MKQKKIGIDKIITTPPENEQLDSPSQLLTDMMDLEMNITELRDRMIIVDQYVQDVSNKKINGDETIGWKISDALLSIPNIDPNKFEEILSGRLQDLLMLEYLSKLTKTHVKFADNANSILYRTLPD